MPLMDKQRKILLVHSFLNLAHAHTEICHGGSRKSHCHNEMMLATKHDPGQVVLAYGLAILGCLTCGKYHITLS